MSVCFDESRHEEDDAVSGLVNIKSGLARSLKDLSVEKEMTKRKIAAAKEEQSRVRKLKAQELQKIYNLRIAIVDADKRAQTHDAYIEEVKETMAGFQKQIRVTMQLDDLEQSMRKIKESIEGAINFYSPDSLQMELAKRSEHYRELRVEYTKVENETKELQKRIEEAKLEKERAKQAELERARQEEERLKKQAEERVLEEGAKKREQFLQERNSPFVPPPFLVEPAPKPVNGNASLESNGIRPSSAGEAQSDDKATLDKSINKSVAQYSDICLSQLLQW